MKKLDNLFQSVSSEKSDTTFTSEIDSTPIEAPNTAVFQDYMLNDPQFIGFEDHDMLEFCYRLATYGILTPEVKSILDLKSRRGDLISYITNARKITNIKYIGVEPTTLMYDIANQKNKFENVTYINDSIFSVNDLKSDLVFSICGLTKTDNVKKLAPNVLLKSLIETMIKNKADGGKCILILTNLSVDIGDFYQIHPITAIQIFDELNIRYGVDYLDNEQIYKLFF